MLVPTAASVTAFTSSLAVLLVDGVKRTRPSRFPDAVVCDLETLADAPPAMTRAGLGDCVARFISYGDWYLAHQLGLVDRYSETPLALMGEDLDEIYLEHAPLVAPGTPDGLAFLVRQVLLAGLAQSDRADLDAALGHRARRLARPGHGRRMPGAGRRRCTAPRWAWRRRWPPAPTSCCTSASIPAEAAPTPPAPEAVEATHPGGVRGAGPERPDGRRVLARLSAASWPLWTAAGDALRRGARALGRRGRRRGCGQLVRPSATIREILRRAGHPLTLRGPGPADPARAGSFRAGQRAPDPRAVRDRRPALVAGPGRGRAWRTTCSPPAMPGSTAQPAEAAPPADAAATCDAEHPELPSRTRRTGFWMLAAVCVAPFVTQLATFALSPFLPFIAADLGTTVAVLGQIPALALLTAAVLGLVVGPLADRFGHRRTLLAGVIASSVGAIATAFAPSLLILIPVALIGAGRAVVGLPVAMAVVRDDVQPARRCGGGSGWSRRRARSRRLSGFRW